MIRSDEAGNEEIIISSTPDTPTVSEAISIAESSTSIDEYDPTREIEGVHPKIRSCLSCEHVKTCKIFEVQAIHAQHLAELAKRSQITLDITPPEAIGVGCGEYKSGTIKEQKP